MTVVVDPKTPLLAWRTLPFPADWDAIFGVGGALVLEVGFGDGRFTVRRAQAEPQVRFVGLEVSSASLQRALRRVRRTGVPNVRLAKAGAAFALQQLFAPASLQAIVVNFPDPWPKERHAKHRLLQRRFFDLAAARLTPGGEIRLATDHPEYLAFALAESEASGRYRAETPEPPDDVFETKYALKWRDQGKPLHYVVFRRRDEDADPFPHLERPATMPHALLHGTLPEAAPFEKIVLPYQTGHVILHEAARVLGGEGGGGSAGHTGDRWLVRATVEEPDLKQQLLVVAHQRTADEVIVRLESFGDPIITPTVRGAVHAVTEWLLGVTRLRLVARNY